MKNKLTNFFSFCINQTFSFYKLFIFALFTSLLFYFFYFFSFMKFSNHNSPFVTLKPNYQLENDLIIFLGKIQSKNWFGENDEISYFLFQDLIERSRISQKHKYVRRFDRDIVIFLTNGFESDELNTLNNLLKRTSHDQARSLALTAEQFIEKKSDEQSYLFIAELKLKRKQHNKMLKERINIPNEKIQAFLQNKLIKLKSEENRDNRIFLPYTVEYEKGKRYLDRPSFSTLIFASLISGLATTFLFFSFHFFRGNLKKIMK